MAGINVDVYLKLILQIAVSLGSFWVADVRIRAQCCLDHQFGFEPQIRQD